MSNRLSEMRVADKVLSNIIHGYGNSTSIAPFVAPVVPVEQRAAKVVRFTKENFVLLDTKRSPGDYIKRTNVSYTSDNISLDQYAIAGKVTEEEYEEARSTEARIDLRQAAAFRAAEAVMQSWEYDVVKAICDPTRYETSCTAGLATAAQWSTASTSDPEKDIAAAREAVRGQIGVYPNSMVISPRVYQALKNHPIFRDRIKYTSSSSVNLDMLSQWFDLNRGVRVASRVYLDQATGQLKDFMEDKVVLFYNPERGFGDGFVPAQYADKAVPAFAYTYSLKGYPIVTPERFEEDTRSFITDVIWEQALVLTGLGATDKVGSGFLLTNVVA